MPNNAILEAVIHGVISTFVFRALELMGLEATRAVLTRVRCVGAY